MAHKTLIGGTAYEIKGGRDLIGGTGYEKKQGKTLVNGTARAISFAPEEYILTIIGGNTGTTGAYVTYAGTKYGSGTLRIPIGASVNIVVGYSQMSYANVTLTGAGTLTNLDSTSSSKRYKYTPARDATIQFEKISPSPQNPSIYYWRGTITEAAV